MLGQIANPAQADIVGALDYRQRKLEDDERKRKEIKVNQLIAEAMPGLNPDGKLFQIAQEDPQKYMMVAQVLGVPTNSGQMIQRFADDAAYLSSLPIGESLEEARRIIAEREEAGQDAGPIKKYPASAGRDGDAVAYEALRYMSGSLNNSSDKNPVQQGTYIPGKGYAVLRKDGTTELSELTPDQQQGVNAALDADAQRKIRTEGGKAGARLDVALEKEPELVGTKEAAKQQAAAGVRREGVDRDNATTYRMYTTAMSGLMDGLAGTETGPIAGRLPALTSNQQIAEGSISAMAPILKSLFRTAGEGTFTDKDQELLLRMVPTRTDTPEAIRAKMENIDKIVGAKLGVNRESEASQPKVINWSDM